MGFWLTKRELGWKRLLAMIVAVAVILSISAFLARPDRPDRRLITRSRMDVMSDRVELYIIEKGALPASAAQLPPHSYKEDSPLDAWGRPISFSIQFGGDFTVLRIRSLGADGRPGGSVESEDIERAYDLTAYVKRYVRTDQ